MEEYVADVRSPVMKTVTLIWLTLINDNIGAEIFGYTRW